MLEHWAKAGCFAKDCFGQGSFVRGHFDGIHSALGRFGKGSSVTEVSLVARFVLEGSGGCSSLAQLRV